jgi:predicted ABC-type ATPase
VAVNLARIAQRVRQGGHDVPEDDVRRRYRRGIANFLNVYRALADSWVVFDNSGPWPREIAFALYGERTTLDADTFYQFVRSGEEP